MLLLYVCIYRGLILIIAVSRHLRSIYRLTSNLEHHPCASLYCTDRGTTNIIASLVYIQNVLFWVCPLTKWYIHLLFGVTYFHVQFYSLYILPAAAPDLTNESLSLGIKATAAPQYSVRRVLSTQRRK